MTPEELIADAREDIPALLAEIKRLRAELDSCKKVGRAAGQLIGELQAEIAWLLRLVQP